MGFIYKVTNNTNGKVYIGKTLDSIETRFKEHCSVIKNQKFCKRPFYLALAKYGKENFSIEVIEEVDSSLLDEREQYWIRYYRSYIGFEDCNGYNATLGGDGTIKYDYPLIVDDYLKTKSKETTAKNFNCSLEVVRRACRELGVENFHRTVGVPVKRIDAEGNVKIYQTIRQAALEIATEQKREMQTVRKRINVVVNHKQNQKAYGYYWESL